LVFSAFTPSTTVPKTLCMVPSYTRAFLPLYPCQLPLCLPPQPLPGHGLTSGCEACACARAENTRLPHLWRLACYALQHCLQLVAHDRQNIYRTGHSVAVICAGQRQTHTRHVWLVAGRPYDTHWLPACPCFPLFHCRMPCTLFNTFCLAGCCATFYALRIPRYGCVTARFDADTWAAPRLSSGCDNAAVTLRCSATQRDTTATRSQPLPYLQPFKTPSRMRRQRTATFRRGVFSLNGYVVRGRLGFGCC